MACRATLKINDILEYDKKELETIHDVADDLIADESKPYTEKDKRQDLCKIYVSMGVKVVKLYAPSVILGSLSIASILTSHKIIKSRNLALGSALSLTEKTLREYRGRVKEAVGEDKEYDIFHNIKTEIVEEEVTLKNGNKKKRKKKMRVLPDEPSGHARFFDDSSPYWKESPDANLMFLKSVQRQCNDKLHAQGYLWLNDVYKALGLKESKAGQVVGWIDDPNDPNRDCHVDFGIFDGSVSHRAFVNGEEPVILLDFNVDGLILNDIFDHKTRKGMGLYD